MPTEARLLRLLTWLTPAFPAAPPGHAQDLEAAIRAGDVHDVRTLTTWLAALIEAGPAWTDAVLAKAAWTAVTGEDHMALDAVADLGEALAPTPERRRETMAQGEAFLTAVAAWNPPPIPQAPYPVALGAAAGAAGLPLQPALTAWLHALAANLVSVAVRGIQLGPSDPLRVMAGLEVVIVRTAERACESTLADLDPAPGEPVQPWRDAAPGRLFAG